MYRTNPFIQPFLLLIDIVGYLLFFWLKFRRLSEPKRILLIRLEHVGDVLLTTPAIRALRKRFPRARIDILVRDFTAPILQYNKNINKVIVWNAPWLSKLGVRSSWFDCVRIITQLRRNKYDLAIDFHGDPRNILLASLVAHYRVGFGVRGFGFLLNKIVTYGRQHVIDRNLAVARELGADVRDNNMELSPNQSDVRFATQTLRNLGKVVCIAPGSGREEKNWIPARWATVADTLIEQDGVTILFTGSKREAAMVGGIKRMMRHANRTIDVCGKTSLTQLAALVKQCVLVLSPDSGTMHIARAMNTPLIGLFTVENPREWGYREHLFQHSKAQRAQDITVERVLQKISQLRVL